MADAPGSSKQTPKSIERKRAEVKSRRSSDLEGSVSQVAAELLPKLTKEVPNKEIGSSKSADRVKSRKVQRMEAFKEPAGEATAVVLPEMTKGEVAEQQPCSSKSAEQAKVKERESKEDLKGPSTGKVTAFPPEMTKGEVAEEKPPEKKYLRTCVFNDEYETDHTGRIHRKWTIEYKTHYNIEYEEDPRDYVQTSEIPTYRGMKDLEEVKAAIKKDLGSRAPTIEDLIDLSTYLCHLTDGHMYYEESWEMVRFVGSLFVDNYDSHNPHVLEWLKVFKNAVLDAQAIFFNDWGAFIKI